MQMVNLFKFTQQIPGDDKLRLMSESNVVKVAVFGHTKMVNLGTS